MTANVGSLDRALRAVLGAALLYLAFGSGAPLFDGALATVLAAGAGAVMLVVAATRVCPVYTLLGVRTCKA
ncbi:MAG: DUF2892 domain-containing protein [Pseudomonadota bacterium]